MNKTFIVLLILSVKLFASEYVKGFIEDSHEYAAEMQKIYSPDQHILISLGTSMNPVLELVQQSAEQSFEIYEIPIERIKYYRFLTPEKKYELLSAFLPLSDQVLGKTIVLTRFLWTGLSMSYIIDDIHEDIQNYYQRNQDILFHFLWQQDNYHRSLNSSDPVTNYQNNVTVVDKTQFKNFHRSRMIKQDLFHRTLQPIDLFKNDNPIFERLANPDYKKTQKLLSKGSTNRCLEIIESLIY